MEEDLPGDWDSSPGVGMKIILNENCPLHSHSFFCQTSQEYMIEFMGILIGRGDAKF